jgi:hypothetical protein
MEYRINYKIDDNQQIKLSLREVLLIEAMKKVNMVFELNYPLEMLMTISKKIHRYIKTKEPLIGSAEMFAVFYLLNAKSREVQTMDEFYETFWIRSQHQAWMPVKELILGNDEIRKYIHQPSKKFRIVEERVYQPSKTTQSSVQKNYVIKLKR